MALTFQELEEEFEVKNYERRKARKRILENLKMLRKMSDQENRICILNETNSATKEDFVYTYMEKRSRPSPLSCAAPPFADSMRRMYNRTMKEEEEYNSLFKSGCEYLHPLRKK